MHVAAHSVFRAKQCHKLNAFGFMKNVDGRLQVVVNACRIGYQTYTLACKLLEIIVAEHLHARLRRRSSAKRRRNTQSDC